MNATAILERLADLGVTVTVDGEALELMPGDRVPEDLVPELRAHKSAIIERLRHQPNTDERRYCRACTCDTDVGGEAL